MPRQPITASATKLARHPHVADISGIRMPAATMPTVEPCATIEIGRLRLSLGNRL
jgi:hypothetical protein